MNGLSLFIYHFKVLTGFNELPRDPVLAGGNDYFDLRKGGLPNTPPNTEKTCCAGVAAIVVIFPVGNGEINAVLEVLEGPF